MPNVFSGTGGVLLRQKNSSGGMVHTATQRRARTWGTILRIMKILSCTRRKRAGENANIDACWAFYPAVFSAYINTVTRVLVSSDRVAAMIVASPSVVTIEAPHGRPIAVSDKGDRDPD